MKNVTNKTYLKRTDDQHEHYHGEIHHRFLSECQKKCGILLFLLHCGLQLVQMILVSLSTDQMPNLNQSRLSQLRFPALQPVACFFFFLLWNLIGSIIFLCALIDVVVTQFGFGFTIFNREALQELKLSLLVMPFTIAKNMFHQIIGKDLQFQPPLP